MFLLIVLTMGDVYTTILGQIGSKMGFWGGFGRVSRKETQNFGFP